MPPKAIHRQFVKTPSRMPGSIRGLCTIGHCIRVELGSWRKMNGPISRCLYPWTLWQGSVLSALMSGVIDGLLNGCNLLLQHGPPSYLLACFAVEGFQHYLGFRLDALLVLNGRDYGLHSEVLASDSVSSFSLRNITLLTFGRFR